MNAVPQTWPWFVIEEEFVPSTGELPEPRWLIISQPFASQETADAALATINRRGGGPKRRVRQL
jgi:hypothetical protein